MFLVCAMLLAIRGATGAVAIYLPYEQYWAEDRLFYSLDTLPEFLTLVILSWPGFMGRMAQSYPKSLQKHKNKKQTSKAETARERSQQSQRQGMNGSTAQSSVNVDSRAQDGRVSYSGQHAGNGLASQV